MYFESHAHYDDKRFNNDRDELLSHILKKEKISHVINIGSNMKNSEESVKLSKKYDYIFAAVGVHPHNAKEMKNSDFELLLKLSKEKGVVAIGEIGLDFHYDFSPREVQRKIFEEQLNLSLQAKLPVVIHEREASQEVFNTIKKSSVRQGVIHCFSSSAEMAKLYVNLGFFIGIGGVLTYPNAVSMKKVVEAVPISHILIETDSPYLTPVPNRGKRNDSTNLKYVVEEIAKIKNLSHEDVAKKTSDNAKLLFNIN